MPPGESSDASRFLGDVPANYHSGLGRLLFEPYAEELVTRVVALNPQRILETACGTGIVTERMAAACEQASIVATDLNDAMIAVARQAVPGRVDLQVADMAALPFPDRAFDLVVCQFGLMFVPDKAPAVREARRVLVPGGTWLLATWAPLDRNDVQRLAHEAIGSLFPDDPPPFYETPFTLGDPAVLRALLEAGGFTSVSIETVHLTGHATTARLAATGLVLGNPVVEQILSRDASRMDDAVDRVERVLAKRYGERDLEVVLEALVTTAG
jgi:SAM-dependent methyltransferase